MDKKLNIPKPVVTADQEDKIFLNQCVEITDGKISGIRKFTGDKIILFLL